MIYIYKRGNVQAEHDGKEKQLAVLIETSRLSVYDLRDTFLRIGDYPKQVPRLGRPPLTPAEKLSRKIEREANKGQLQITYSQCLI